MRWLSWAVKAALSIVIIWYVLAHVDLVAVWQHAAAAHWAWIAAATATQTLQMPMGGRRWQIVLEAIGGRLSLLQCTTIYYISTFFNLVLPGVVGGDSFRIWKARRGGLPLAQAINSVMLERVASLFGLLLLVTATEPILANRVGSIPGAWAFPALTALGFTGIIALAFLDRLPSALHHLSIVRGMIALAGDVRRAFLRPVSATAVLFWSVGGHVNLAVVAWLLARSLDLEVTLLDCLVLVPPVVLLTTLPISIAGWGLREGAMVAAFHLVGVSTEPALVLSVLFGIANTLVSVPAGILWLVSPDRQQPELAQ